MNTQPLNSEPPSGPVEGRAVAEIRALCDAATPGPWEVRTVDDGKYYGQPATFDVVSVAGPRQEPVASGGFAEDGGPELGAAEAADAQFIATARELVPQLLAEVEAAHRFERSEAVEREALLGEVERLREDLAYAIADAKRWHDGWQELGRIYAADVDALRVERDSLRGVVQAAREHHYEDAGSCVSCVDEFDNPHAWPCPTARVLTPASPEGSAGTELVWVNDEIGYRCPVCALFVCIPRREVAYCPARHAAAAADAPQPAAAPSVDHGRMLPGDVFLPTELRVATHKRTIRQRIEPIEQHGENDHA